MTAGCLNGKFQNEIYQVIPNSIHSFDFSCFIFTISDLNPSHSRWASEPSNAFTRDLHDYKQDRFSSHFHSWRESVNVITSNNFKIVAVPNMFTEPWFNREFGGEDLNRFIGHFIYNH